MNASILPSPSEARRSKSDAWTRFGRRLVESQLEQLTRGEVTLIDGDRVSRRGVPSDLAAAVEVRDPEFYSDVAFGGSLGAAESYIRGRWSADDLTALLRIFARNLDVSDQMEQGWARLAAPAARWFHKLRSNTKSGSQKNIEAHYDLGNDLFQLFLDPTMNYSAGIFETPETTLEQASVAKMNRLCRKLDLHSDDHLLEIGTGWGAMAMHAASEYGCRVTTTTISKEQHRLASERIAAAGLDDRITVLLSDYRDLTGTYSKIVSVEMIEAVGHDFLESYFGQCGRLLAPDGLLAVQGITMAEHRYDRYRREVDFIQRYVFPGSCLPSVAAMCQAAGNASDLRPAHLEDMTPHYAETLRRWRENFFANVDQVRAIGYSDEFIRMWDYYLCYCEAGFDEGTCGSVQLVWAKPARRRETVDLAARPKHLETRCGI